MERDLKELEIKKEKTIQLLTFKNIMTVKNCKIEKVK